MQREYRGVFELGALHDALLQVLPHLREAMALESDGAAVRIALPDDVAPDAWQVIDQVVAGHDALAAARARRTAAIKQEAHRLLAPTDWYIIRAQETGTPIPQAVLDYRAAVRSAADRAEQDIAALDSVEAVRAYRVEWPPKPEGV